MVIRAEMLRNSDVFVGVGVVVGVFVAVWVAVWVGVIVGVFVGVSDGVIDGVAVGVFVGVAVGVLVGVFVGVVVGVLVGVGPLKLTTTSPAEPPLRFQVAMSWESTPDSTETEMFRGFPVELRVVGADHEE
jgi:hypothetical protein